MRGLPLVALSGLLAAVAPAAGQTAVRPEADSILARPVSLILDRALLGEALTRLRREFDVPLAWSGDLLPPDRRVTVALHDEPLETVLTRVLEGTGLAVAVTMHGTVVIVPGVAAVATEPPGHALREMERVQLATGVRQLDRIVVTGTAVTGAPEREQPTAMNVIRADALAAASHTRMSDVVRTLLPGVVLWDRGPGGPPAQVTSVRGVSSFTTRGLKTYVDGVELASPDLFTLLDGRSIERIEIIRGPQGAALYGPDALNGILQIVTRKGTPGAESVQVRGTAAAGPLERADLARAALWQDHAFGITGGTSWLGFNADVGFTQVGWGTGPPWQQSWSAVGGGRGLVGPVLLSGSARAGGHEHGETPQELSEGAVGVTAEHYLTPAWRHALVVGHHRISGAREPARPGLISPLLPLGATHETAWRSSFRYSSAWEIPFDGSGATVSAGAEYSHRSVKRGVVRPFSARDLQLLYDDALRSTGLFSQARLRIGPHLVVNAGARSEWSSSVGAERGAAWASTAGASWNQAAGPATVRLRAAWGRGLRPPEPGMSRAMATATIEQAANPDLAPERQSGLEAGLDVYLGETAFARVTWYSQHARDLFQQVPIRGGDQAATRVYQFQNVGAIANHGVELEAGVRWRRWTAAGLLYLNRSEVRSLAPFYTGELRPGDELLEAPEGVGTLSLRYEAGRLRAEAGASWLGSWTGYDWEAIAAVERGEVPRRAELRDYWLRYPGVLRPHVMATVHLQREFSAFLRVDNPGNRSRYIRDNISPPLGRTTAIGLEWRR